ncbi:MAG TPA: hypothetical protein VJZ27_05175 [Aggregatilineales bacterium]|nr:hypothetical protein [Aggregatilineales bacterium]
MNGVYDYRGECFGYIENGKLYDLDGKLSGYIDDKAVTALDGSHVWHVYKHGLYNRHWESIGYIGSEIRRNDDN